MPGQHTMILLWNSGSGLVYIAKRRQQTRFITASMHTSGKRKGQTSQSYENNNDQRQEQHWKRLEE